MKLACVPLHSHSRICYLYLKPHHLIWLPTIPTHICRQIPLDSRTTDPTRLTPSRNPSFPTLTSTPFSRTLVTIMPPLCGSSTRRTKRHYFYASIIALATCHSNIFGQWQKSHVGPASQDHHRVSSLPWMQIWQSYLAGLATPPQAKGRQP